MALRLRHYKPCDAESIIGWIKDENALRKWSSDRFGAYPITAEDINRKYLGNNGDCAEPDNFYPFTAFDESGPVGHIILRYTDSEKEVIRFGFVIVDDSKRGRGYGKQMLMLAVKYAFELFGAEKITLGVFDHNGPAAGCYKAVGFEETGEETYCRIFGEQWRIVEMELLRQTP